jgi:hypothetical protein
MKKIDLENLMLIASEIEAIVDDKEVNYIDACIMYCEERELEIEYIGDIIKKNQRIRAKVQREAEDLNFIKKQKRF